MSFRTHVVVTRAADQVSGWAASLKKIRGAKAALTFTPRDKLGLALGYADGQRLAVQIGEGEHHGLVRLKVDPAGSALVKHRVAGSGKRGGPYFAIALGHIDLFVDRAEPKKWCAFEVL